MKRPSSWPYRSLWRVWWGDLGWLGGVSVRSLLTRIAPLKPTTAEAWKRVAAAPVVRDERTKLRVIAKRSN
jgi:hypothetical protein